MFLYNFTSIPEIASLVPDHQYKANITVKWITWIFFLVYIKIIILHCGLLSVQMHYVSKINVQTHTHTHTHKINVHTVIKNYFVAKKC